jgi:hypothetical protein
MWTARFSLDQFGSLSRTPYRLDRDSVIILSHFLRICLVSTTWLSNSDITISPNPKTHILHTSRTKEDVDEVVDDEVGNKTVAVHVTTIFGNFKDRVMDNRSKHVYDSTK